LRGGPFPLAGAAIQRLVTGRVSLLLWILLLTVTVAPVLLIASSEAAFPELWAYAANISIVVGVLALLFVVFWMLERSVADYQDRQGDPFAWFGWTLVAYMPLFAAAFAIWRLDIDADFIFRETMIMAPLSLAAPILVHASGRAIDQNGPELSAIWHRWFPNYGALVGAYLLVTVPFYLASDIVWYFMVSNGPTDLLGELVAGLLSNLGSVFAVALTVEAFHRADENHGS
jgi:hypothetical protein